MVHQSRWALTILDDVGLLYLVLGPSGAGDIVFTQFDADGLEIASHLIRRIRSNPSGAGRRVPSCRAPAQRSK